MSAAAPAPLAWALAAWFRLRGILRWPLKPTYGVGDWESGQVVPRESLPPRALSRWAPLIEQLGDLGFSPLLYKIADTIGQKQQAVAMFLDQPGSTIATLEWIRMRGAEGDIEKTPLEFNSYAPEDPEIMTARVTKEELPLADMLKLPFVDMLVLAGQPLAETYRRHAARIEGRSCYQMNPESALQEHAKRSRRRFQWVLDQGLLRPLTEAEISQVRRLSLE
jgi:hypothetical protein